MIHWTICQWVLLPVKLVCWSMCLVCHASFTVFASCCFACELWLCLHVNIQMCYLWKVITCANFDIAVIFVWQVLDDVLKMITCGCWSFEFTWLGTCEALLVTIKGKLRLMFSTSMNVLWFHPYLWHMNDLTCAILVDSFWLGAHIWLKQVWVSIILATSSW